MLLSIEARRQIANDIEAARAASQSLVDDTTLEALGLYSPDGWSIALKSDYGVPA